ncbi:MAG TPA: putative metal-binding motif-containing protein [Polyangiaceae bacterium]|jgi:hypothetical protein|nr:putative metal-binding motif-containing protein [Polyangiaceae bacterium]
MSKKNSAKVRRSNLAIAIVCIGAVGGAVLTESCSSGFTSCDSTKTCSPPTGGAAGTSGQAGGASGDNDGIAGAGGGEAGAAGAGGGDAQPECSRDADCSDGLACDGEETCVAGSCQPGVAPCANPDPANCDALCVELDGAASCSVQGQDKDNDGYLSSACATSPGTDCNDAVAAIHPGATELCNGIDNNCNGKIDLADGLPVSGTTVALGPNGATRGTPAIAWATDTSVYGAMYYDGTTSSDSDLYIETFDQTGAIVLAPAPFNQLLQTGGTRTIALTWGADRFGAGWTIADQSHTYFNTWTSSGVLGDLLEIPEHGEFIDVAAVARVAGGSWAVMSSIAESSSIWGRVVSATGVVSSTETELDSGGQVESGSAQMVASGSNFVIGYARPTAAAASVWSALLAAPPAALNIAGLRPAIGSGPSGFAVAVTPTMAANPPQFYAFGPTGAAACGPVTFADKDFVPAAIVGTAKGYLVASSGSVRVQEILANCVIGSLFTVDAGPATNVSIAGSATGYGLVWQDTTANVPKRRVFGPLFCN